MTTKAEREYLAEFSGKLKELAEDAPKVTIYENGRAKGAVRGRLRNLAQELDQFIAGENGDGNV